MKKRERSECSPAGSDGGDLLSNGEESNVCVSGRGRQPASTTMHTPTMMGSVYENLVGRERESS